MLLKNISKKKITKIAFIFGTRPEALKLLPVIMKFQKSKKYKIYNIITGQHSDLLDNVIEDFKINIHTNLKIMKKGQSLEYVHSKILNRLSPIVKKINPNYIFVQGDTSTTLGASFCAFYNKIPLIHIEAGLRTKDFYSPFPEEMNRRVISRMAYFNFAATMQAKQKLISEGIKSNKIKVVGNTIIDTLILTLNNIYKKKNYYYRYFSSLYNLKFQKKINILVTCHRRENFKSGIFNICEAILKIAKDDNNIQIIFVTHPNPNVQKALKTIKGIKNIYLIPPQKYNFFIYLMSNINLILTDSGGIQEESTYLKKPLLITRNNTER